MVLAGILFAEIFGIIAFSILTIISIYFLFVAIKARQSNSHHISDLYVQVLFLTFLLDLGVIFSYFFGVYATQVSPNTVFSGNIDLYILYTVYWYMAVVLSTISITINHLRNRNITRKGQHPWKFRVHVIYFTTVTVAMAFNMFAIAIFPTSLAIKTKFVGWSTMAIQWASLAISALIVGRKLRRLTKGEFSSPSLRHHWLLVRITVLNWCFFGGNLFCIACDIVVVTRPGLSVYISTIQIQVVYQATGAFVLGFLLWFFNPLAQKNAAVFKKEGNERNPSTPTSLSTSSNASIQLPLIQLPSLQSNTVQVPMNEILESKREKESDLESGKINERNVLVIKM